MSRRARRAAAAEMERVAANWVLRRDAGLGAEEQAEFERWRAENPRHAEALARKARAWELLDRPLRSGQAAELLQQLERRITRNRRRWIGAGTAGLACVIAATAFLQVRKTPALLPPQTHGVVVLPERQTLPDGSVVELRPGAEIAVEFGDAIRRVVLKRGESHFEVRQNHERPFVVAAGGVEVRAVGTRFAVELNREAVDVLVTEGSVAVEKRASAVASPTPASGRPEASAVASRYPPVEAAAGRAHPLATVDAGKRLVVGLDPAARMPAPTVVTADELVARLAWRAPKLEFSEVPLGDAIALMNRHNKVRFVIDDAALARLPISGLFRADNVDTFVRLLEGTCGVKAQRLDGTIRLTKAER